MHEKIDTFLDAVCAHIKYKPVHQDIRDELTNHINELKETFIIETQNEEIALDKALSEMGDCDKIGRQLNEQHKPETEWSLIGLTAMIASIGSIVMYSSSFFESPQAVDFEQYLVFAILGIAVMVGLYFFDYSKLNRLAWPLYLLSVALLVITLLRGGAVNGTSRFIMIGGSAISTDFITLLFLIAFAGFVDKAMDKGSVAVLKLSVLASASVLPIIMQPKIMQAFTLLIGYTTMIIVAIVRNHFGGSRKRQLVMLISLTCLGSFMLFGVIFSEPYRTARFSMWMSASKIGGQSNLSEMAYQQIMADKWLTASNLFGTTTEKINGYGFDRLMPRVTTDYALVNVIATLGWIIGAALILVIAFYIGRMFITTSKIKNNYGFYLSLAACIALAVQFIIGILMNFNFFPPTSVYIPFISYGSVEFVVSMAFMGIILSVWRRNNLAPVSPKNSDCVDLQSLTMQNE